MEMLPLLTSPTEVLSFFHAVFSSTASFIDPPRRKWSLPLWIFISLFAYLYQMILSRNCKIISSPRQLWRNGQLILLIQLQISRFKGVNCIVNGTTQRWSSRLLCALSYIHKTWCGRFWNKFGSIWSTAQPLVTLKHCHDLLSFIWEVSWETELII